MSKVHHLNTKYNLHRFPEICSETDHYRLIKFHSYSDVILTTNKIPLRHMVNGLHPTFTNKPNLDTVHLMELKWVKIQVFIKSIFFSFHYTDQCRSIWFNLEMQEKCILQSLIKICIYYLIYLGGVKDMKLIWSHISFVTHFK